MVSQAESIDRPLRLGVDEASALLVALRMLAEVGQVGGPGRTEGSALSRTIAKLEAAAGEAAAPSAQVAVQVDRHAERSVAAQLREALAAGRRVHLSYYVPGPRRGDRAGRRPDAAAGRWRAGPTWRAGAGAPRRSACSGSTGCSPGQGARGRRPRCRGRRSP